MESSSFLSSPSILLLVTTSKGCATLHVHQAVLDKIPYFHAQRSRWSDPATGTLKVELAENTDISDLTCIFEHFYASKQPPVPALKMNQALHQCQIASMLGCDAKTVEFFATAIRSNVHNLEDVAQVNQFADMLEVPEVKNVAKRLKTDPDKPNLETLKNMFVGAVRRNDKNMLEAASQHLKVLSWQGKGALKSVVEILCSDVGDSLVGMPLALEFIKVHPSFYKDVVSKVFTRTYVEKTRHHEFTHGSIDRPYGTKWSEEHGKHFLLFMHIGVEKYQKGELTIDDITSFIKVTTKQNAYVYQDSLFFRALKDTSCLIEVLEKLDADAQVKICKVLLSLSGQDRAVATIFNNQLVSALVLEAKRLVAQRAAGFGPYSSEFKTFWKADVIKILGRPLVVDILDRAHELEDDAMTALFALTKPASLSDGVVAYF